MGIPERMPCRYDTENDLHARLSGTICRYKDEPVYVYVDGLAIYLKHPVTKADITKIKWNDPDFDISSPELGYFNLLVLEKGGTKSRVFYAERHPLKKWRQGLNTNHMTYSKIDGDENSHVPGYPQDNWIYSDGFCDMIRNKYPSLDEAFEILENGEREIYDSFSKTYAKKPCKEIAISKDVAIEITKSGVYQVYYKADNIGWIAPGTRQVNVKSSEIGWIISKFLQQFSWKVE